MLSDTVVEFVDNIQGHSPAGPVQVVLEPAECLAFLSFVSVFWQWRSSPSKLLN